MYIEDRPNFQLALDMLDLNEAIKLAIEVDEYVDFFEVGTLLIHNNGIAAVNRVKAQFSYKPVVADLKVMDAADIELRMVSLAQADLVTIMACAPVETVRLALERAHRYGLRVIVDLLGVRDQESRLRELEQVSPDFVLVHAGMDQQQAGLIPLGELEALAPKTHLAMGIAGGLTPDDIPRIRNIPNLGLVVVGSAITTSPHPAEAARQFRAVLNR
jgi:3-hexulose-6-phosphate synthase